MFSSDQPQSGHHLRFYIVMATLVIGGIFFFLLMNNNGEGSFTSTVGKAIDSAPLLGDSADSSDVSAVVSESGSKSSSSKNAHLVSVKMDVDKVPSFKKKISAADITIKFKDVDSQVSVNNDRLELHNLDSVEMKVSGFEGDAGLDALGLALDGTARRIEVNGVVLASAKDIKVSFGKITYDYADFDQLVISDLAVPASSGDITVSDRLSYKLAGESVALNSVQGRLTFDNSGASVTTFEGTARGIDFAGEALTLQVR